MTTYDKQYKADFMDQIDISKEEKNKKQRKIKKGENCSRNMEPITKKRKRHA
jgi:hypothetical protein